MGKGVNCDRHLRMTFGNLSLVSNLDANKLSPGFLNLFEPVTFARKITLSKPAWCLSSSKRWLMVDGCWWCETGKVTTTISENGCVAKWQNNWARVRFFCRPMISRFFPGSTWKATFWESWDTPMDDNLGDKSRYLLDLYGGMLDFAAFIVTRMHFPKKPKTAPNFNREYNLLKLFAESCWVRFWKGNLASLSSPICWNFISKTKKNHLHLRPVLAGPRGLKMFVARSTAPDGQLRVQRPSSAAKSGPRHFLGISGFPDVRCQGIFSPWDAGEYYMIGTDFTSYNWACWSHFYAIGQYRWFETFTDCIFTTLRVVRVETMYHFGLALVGICREFILFDSERITSRWLHSLELLRQSWDTYSSVYCFHSSSVSYCLECNDDNMPSHIKSNLSEAGVFSFVGSFWVVVSNLWRKKIDP